MRPIPLPRVTAQFRPIRPMPRLRWLLPVMLVTIVAGVVGIGVLARRESSTVRITRATGMAKSPSSAGRDRPPVRWEARSFAVTSLSKGGSSRLVDA